MLHWVRCPILRVWPVGLRTAGRPVCRTSFSASLMALSTDEGGHRGSTNSTSKCINLWMTNILMRNTNPQMENSSMNGILSILYCCMLYIYRAVIIIIIVIIIAWTPVSQIEYNFEHILLTFPQSDRNEHCPPRSKCPTCWGYLDMFFFVRSSISSLVRWFIRSQTTIFS